MLNASFSNPFRVPNWRWLRAAGYLAGEQLAPTRKRDGVPGYRWVKRAAQFQRALERCAGNQLALHRLAESDSAIFWAYWAHEDTNSMMRWQIEAHLLARATDWEVAFSAGVHPSIIEAYEALFFNIRERLNHTGYIMHCAIGPAAQRGLAAREFDTLWKLYGYFNGPAMLQALITKFPSPGWCSSPDAVSAALQDDAISTLKLKATLAAKTVPINAETQLELLHIFTKFVEVERTTDTVGKAQGQLMDHVAAMMKSLPFNVNGRDPRQDHQMIPADPLTPFRESAVELSYAEVLAVSAGQPLANRDMILQLGQVDQDGNSLAYPPVATINLGEAT